MVFRTEENKDGEQKVRVLFMNPTHMSMVPCSFFLNGKCRFTEEKCRYLFYFKCEHSDGQFMIVDQIFRWTIFNYLHCYFLTNLAQSLVVVFMYLKF